MRNVARSLLVVLMSVSACFKAGESRTGSAAPALVEPSASTVEPLASPEPAARVAPVLAHAGPGMADAVPSFEPSVEMVEEVPPREVIDTVELLGHATVRAEPRIDAPALGLVAIGGRVDVYERVEGTGCRKDWLAIAPHGFICARTQHTRRTADGILPEVPDGARVPGVYGSVAKDALVYAGRDAASRGEGQLPGRHLTVRRDDSVLVDGQHFWKTRYGLIRERDVRRLKGTKFHGELLEDGLTHPLAWTLPAPKTKTVPVLERPERGASVVARLGARQARMVLEEVDGFVRVDDGWLALEHVRVARPASPPEDVADDERWIDIDLSQQVLVAYEGTTAIYATLISSGRAGHRTPTGVYRISRKVAQRTMNSMADSSDTYSVDRVPWTAYFDTGYALHTAFWHGGFGRTRSHGCINLAPLDARPLYDWMTPAAAPGWAEVYGHEAQPGALVRIRSDRNPDPQWKGYAKDLHEAEPVRVAQAG